MSQPLSHSDPLRIVEEYLSADLTKYTTERSTVFIWGGYLFTSWMQLLITYQFHCQLFSVQHNSALRSEQYWSVREAVLLHATHHYWYIPPSYSGFRAFLLRRMLRSMCIVRSYMLTLEGKGRPFEWNIWLPWSVLLIAVSYEEDLYIARSLHAPYPQFV